VVWCGAGTGVMYLSGVVCLRSWDMSVPVREKSGAQSSR